MQKDAKSVDKFINIGYIINMKVKYKTVDIRTVKGIEKAESLKAAGWKVNTHSPDTIQFYKENKKMMGK